MNCNLELKLRRMAEKRGINLNEVFVTVADSLAMKNCEEGTLEVLNNYFTGRDGAYVSELLEIPLEGKFREWAIAASAYSLRKHKRINSKENTLFKE